MLRDGGSRIVRGGIRRLSGRRLMVSGTILQLQDIWIIASIAMAAGLVQTEPGMESAQVATGEVILPAGGMWTTQAGIL